MRRNLFITLLLLLTFALVNCRDQQTDEPTPTPDGVVTPDPDSGNTGEQTGESNMILQVDPFASAENASQPRFGMRLSAGNPEADAAPVPNQLVQGEPLSADLIEQILARLPDLQGETGDQVELNLPTQPIPPPLTGETIDEPFPSPGEVAPPPVEVVNNDGDLAVIRFAPEGDVTIAPFIAVTFNQPMVPIATQEQLAAIDVPMVMTPSLPGEWIWLGTQTARFEFDSEQIDRLPMSTEVTIEIPAGTTSETGGTLPETVSFSFRTPTPQVQTFYPQNGSQPLEPIFFAGFDQRIDPAAILDVITLTAGREEVALRLATDEEIAADERVSTLSANHPDNRWLAFRAVDPFQPDTPIQIEIGPNVPSLEGPRTTEQTFSYSTRTYPPLAVIETRCGYNNNCPPYGEVRIYFSNQLDANLFDINWVTIEPEIPNAIVGVFGGNISIRGAWQPRSTYTVRLSGDIQDIFGQTLGDDYEFKQDIDSADPTLFGANRPLVTLDPAAPTPAISIYSINVPRVDVQVYKVTPDNWTEFLDYQQNAYRDNPPSPPGELIVDETIAIDGEDDKLTTTQIDVSGALNGEYGHAIIHVTPTEGLVDRFTNRYRPVVTHWVQVTDIGVDALLGEAEMIVWANNLSDGAPISDATVAYGGQTTTTSADGTVSILSFPNRIQYLTVQNGNDRAILPANEYGYGEWYIEQSREQVRWVVFDDRAMYRPGETVSVKGFVRKVETGALGDIALWDGSQTINYLIRGSQGNQLSSGTVELSALGGFELTFDLPEEVNLGYAGIEFSLSSRYNHYHNFQIQEFRRPEFEVTARNETPSPHFIGGHAVVGVSAEYFAGGPLPNAEVYWNVSSNPTTYSPPNWSDFSFGKWTPWWGWYDEGFYEYESGSSFESFEGRTDASGDHYLRIDFDEFEASKPYSVNANAEVIDVNRQGWGASTSLLVHPSELYVGLRSDRYFVRKGTPLDIEAIVTDIDGNAVPNTAITVTAARLEWTFSGGRWQQTEADVQTCNVTSGTEAVICTFTTDEGGQYRITAMVSDEQGRSNESEITRWVSGGDRRPNRNVEQEQVTIIPSQENFAPGDVAELLIQSPIPNAEGLLTLTRQGIVSTERFTMEGDTTVIEIPIEDAYLPNLNVQIDLVGAQPRTSDDGTPLPDLPARPAYAVGSIELPISTRSRELDIELNPQETGLEPGGSTTIDITVSDAQGIPVTNSEIALVVVDEAVLALTNYQLVNPLNIFYQNRYTYLQGSHSRAQLVLVDPIQLMDAANRLTFVAQSAGRDRAEFEVIEEAEMMASDSADDGAMLNSFAAEPTMMAQAGADESAGENQDPIQVRTNFDALALFAPTVTTNAEGQASVEVTLPDNLTRYRIMAVAVSGETLFGSAESNLTARLPLMVRPSAPRFLNFGDSFELPVVLQNQTDEEMVVDVVVEATNVTLTDGNGQRVTVPANDRVEVRFPTTTQEPGTARFQFAAVSGDYVDAANIDLPVYTPATTEAFATYGVIDEGAIAQTVAVPEGVYTQFGGLEIGTSSTALQALTDAVIYLVDYPYESSEARASRILAIAALQDVLSAFDADGLPEQAEIEAQIREDIEGIARLQTGDGGFRWWSSNRISYPFLTVHVTHALVRAQANGYDVPFDMLDQALDYLQDVDRHFPSWYSEEIKNTIRAYALYVRDLSGDNDRSAALALYNRVGADELAPEALAWIWQVIGSEGAESAEISRYFTNRAVETANAATFTTNYSDDAYVIMHSNRRTDGVILDALIANDPDSDLIVKVVNGLLADKTRGRWNNTQENVFILLAMDRYFETFEAQTPDFVARVWLGETYAAEHVYEGRTTDRHATDVPLTFLTESEDAQNVIISKDGDGRLYYRLGLRYAPSDLQLDPLDRGFIVLREYEAVDDPSDVTQDADGNWHIKAGAKVRVKLTMVADSRRTHVALVSPLPAGLEIINEGLANAVVVPDAPADEDEEPVWSWWWWRWYDHVNLRDERAEAFTTLLNAGVHEYEFVARATTPGEFVVPPAKAEEMYSPEVFGRSASEIVIVETP